MKILINESQFIKILNEVRQNPYIDSLLDKIGSSGFDSLTPDEKADLDRFSNGEEVEQPKLPEPKHHEKSHERTPPNTEHGEEAYHMFMDIIPPYQELTVDGKQWSAGIEEDHIIVSDGEIEFFLTPFLEGVGITIETQMGDKFFYRVESIPRTPDVMDKFARYFFGMVLPQLIKKILKMRR